MTRRHRLFARLFFSAVGVLLAAFLVHAAARAQNTRQKIAIVPFAVSGDPDLTGMGDFVPDMLASRLEERGSFAFADTAPLRGTLTPQEKGLLSQDRAASLASRLGVDYVVSGTLSRRDGAEAFTAQVYRKDGTPVGDRVVIPVKGPDDVLNQLEPLADSVAGTLGSAGGAPASARAAAPAAEQTAKAEADTAAARAAAEEKARAEAEAARVAQAGQARKESEAVRIAEEQRAKAEALAAAQSTAQEKARSEAAAKAEAEAQASRLAAEQTAKAEADTAAARAAAEERARAEAEAARVAQAGQARKEAEAARIAEEQRAKAEALAAAQSTAQEKARSEAAAKAEAEAQASRLAAEQTAKAEADTAAARAAAEEKARAEAEAARVAQAGQARKESEAARIAEEQRAKAEALAAAQSTAQEKARSEAAAKAEAEAQASRLAAEQTAKAEADTAAARAAAEERARAEAEAARVAQAGQAGKEAAGAGVEAAGGAVSAGAPSASAAPRSMAPRGARLPAGGASNAPIWTSQPMEGEILGFDVADVSGDGLNELVAVTSRTILFYRFETGGLRLIQRVIGGSDDAFQGVEAGDLDGDGIAEIAVTSVRGDAASSFVLKRRGDGFVRVLQGSPYALRVTDCGTGPALLIGQRVSNNLRTEPPIVIFGGLSQGSMPTEYADLPEWIGLYDIAAGRPRGAGEEIFVLDPKTGAPAVYRREGGVRWHARAPLMELDPGAATGEVRLGAVSPVARCPRPAGPDGARMLLVRTENDPLDPSVAGPLLLGLRWSGSGYTETFRLGEFRSKLADFQWRDLDDDGTSEVLVCLVSPYTEGRESRIEVWRPAPRRR